jgi:TolB-like protein/DNA-binding winged helix-turn-helix (wHTH) protein/Flp pilus assembly protein TadD
VGESVAVRPLLRIGDDVELDVRAYELRRAGRAVRLERIPMQILLLLVERRPDLVTREEIVEKIWGRGVFFDTDNSINVAIRKIRQALGDDPEKSGFVRTLTGMGYRFIAPVTASGEAATPAEGVPAREPEPPAEEPEPVVASPVSVPSPGSAPADASSAEIQPTAAARRAHSPSRRLAALAALALVILATLWLRRSHTAAGPHNERRMLAVLPFENLTGDAGQDYYADGFTEEMITRLGALDPRRVGVIARTSAMYYKHAPAPLDVIGRALGVQYVLEGSVRREADRVRVTAQLIQVADQTHLWAREYDREQTDVLRVQQEIATAIAGQIVQALDGSSGPPDGGTAPSPRSAEAYDLLLQGRFSLNKRSREGFQQAIELFQRAVARDPGEARGYADLADAWCLMGSYSYVPPDEAAPKARAAALRALEIDPQLAAAHTALAFINEFYDWDWATAGERFRRAIELSPNDVTAHHWYAEYLAFQGRFDEALAESDFARQLDPLSRIIVADRGAILYFARRYDDAIEMFRSVLAAEPNFPRAHLIVYAYSQQGRFDAALNHIQYWERTEPSPWSHALTAYVYGRLGRAAEARQAAGEIESANSGWEGDRILPRVTASIGMGLEDEAFAGLQRECENRSTMIVGLKVDPLFDPLRGDSRFEDLLRCVHLDSGRGEGQPTSHK